MIEYGGQLAEMGDEDNDDDDDTVTGVCLMCVLVVGSVAV